VQTQSKTLQQCQADRDRDRVQLARARRERDALRDRAAEASPPAQDDAAKARAEADELRSRVQELEALIAKHTAVFAVSEADLRRGRLVGLRPNAAPRGKLAPYLEPAAGDPALLELSPLAAITIGKHRVDRVTVQLTGTKIDVVELVLFGRGDGEVAPIVELAERLCPKKTEWYHGKPGPLGPVDPATGKRLPRIRLSKLDCSLKARPWKLAVEARRSRDGAATNVIDLALRFAR
jgi:hypothetical protein